VRDAHIPRIVLDTHVVVHAANGDLSPARTRLLENERSELLISAVTLWELTKLVELGHLQMPDGFESFMRALCAHPRYTIAAYDAALMLELLQVAPRMHKDPADQIIVATTRVRDAVLMTDDAHIRRSKLVPVL
jgi:PIN domain nuclease of toxin-antitoxin system